MNEIELKYGCNPNQTPARVYADGGLPFTVLNGRPGYINLLDALNSWQLVRELRAMSGLPAPSTVIVFVSPSLPAGMGNDASVRFSTNEKVSGFEGFGPSIFFSTTGSCVVGRGA